MNIFFFNLNFSCIVKVSKGVVNPYKPMLLLKGHKQRVKIQIRHDIIWRLFRICSVCFQNDLSKYEEK